MKRVHANTHPKPTIEITRGALQALGLRLLYEGRDDKGRPQFYHWGPGQMYAVTD